MANKTLTDIELQKAQRIRNPLVKRLYTLKEAAEYLGRSEWGMRNLVWAQAIPVVKQPDVSQNLSGYKRSGCIYRKKQGHI